MDEIKKKHFRMSQTEWHSFCDGDDFEGTLQRFELTTLRSSEVVSESTRFDRILCREDDRLFYLRLLYPIAFALIFSRTVDKASS